MFSRSVVTLTSSHEGSCAEKTVHCPTDFLFRFILFSGTRNERTRVPELVTPTSNLSAVRRVVASNASNHTGRLPPAIGGAKAAAGPA